MREIVEKFKVYSYEELPKDVQKKVLESEREGKYKYGDYVNDEITEWVKEELDKLGLPSNDIRWSYSSSQGDGLAFYGRFDWKKQTLVKVTKAQIELIEDAIVMAEIVSTSNHYAHYNTMSISFHGFYTTKQMAVVEKIEAELLEAVRELSKKLYRELGKKYEANFTDAAILADIEANENEYTVDGKIYRERSA